MKRLKIIAINLLVLAFLIPVGELVLELYFMVKDKGSFEEQITEIRRELPNYEPYDWSDEYWDEFPRAKVQYHSYVGWKGIPLQGNQINIDSNGYRLTTNNTSFEEAKYQVAFLGGSTTWGTGSNDAGTIPSIFSSQCDSCYTWNFGQPAYVAHQGLNALHLEISQGYRPNLVVSYDGCNDMPSHRKAFTHAREIQIRKAMTNADQRSNEQFLWGYKRALKALRFDPNNIPELSHLKVGRDQLEHDCAVAFLEGWLTLKNLCDDHGIDLILVLQPNITVGNADIKHLADFWDKAKNPDVSLAQPYYDKVLALLQTERFAPLRNHFHDFSNALDNVPAAYIDYGHLSPNGNEIIANRMLDVWQKTKIENSVTSPNTTIH